MKKLLLMLAAVGMIFTACEGNGGQDDETNDNPTEQPGNGENGGKDDVEIPADKTQAIKFQDEATKLLCTLHWDENEDGELSYEEAAAITDLGTAFKGSSILAFTELKYFTGLAEIADNAFEGCVSLVKITLPEQITTIGISAFEGCTNLKKIEIPDSVTSIGEHAFYGCTSLARVDISDLSAWCKIGFGNDANPLRNGAKLYLDNNEITELVIPSDITEIKKDAFQGYTSLTSVTIHDSVTSIGYAAFYGCTGELIINSKIIETDYNYQYTSSYYPAYCNNVWLDDSNFTKLTIGNNITKIGSYAFYGCISLTSVTIPDSITSIGDGAFRYCSSLTSVTIPDSITSIGSNAFWGCESLTSITIPDSVTEIGRYAFTDCSSLKNVYCKPTTPPSGRSYMFDDNASDRKIYVPRASVNAYKSALFWRNYASAIVGYDF